MWMLAEILKSKSKYITLKEKKYLKFKEIVKYTPEVELKLRN